MIRAISELSHLRPLGRVTGASGGLIQVSGLSASARLGDRVTLGLSPDPRNGEIVRITTVGLDCLLEGSADGVHLGDPVLLCPRPGFAPDSAWIGRVVDPDGMPLDGRPLVTGTQVRELRAQPLPARSRRPMGNRLATGLAVFDTLLPIARGQRLGLFAGSGVGKSTLLADLARGVDADVIVIGLVGERGREVSHFVEDVLGPKGMARSVIVAATSDKPPQLRRRCAWAATAVAEHFRDEGQQVLLLIDSVTRFAEAHREIAATVGDPALLRGYPSSTGPEIAALCERAGPGAQSGGDITAIYSVLVAGSDMEEPIADILRGVLDGHVVLDREIAERGRFPAVDLLRSVSRSLPACASEQENGLILQARRHLGVYSRAELMIQSGLYTAGSDPEIDKAITCAGPLEEFLSRRDIASPSDAFESLRRLLAACLQSERRVAPKQARRFNQV
jgi:flagellum-specific ATP synthase